MAIDDSFLGISLEFDESLSQFQGITLELTENLIVKVVDGLGQTVDGAEVSFTIAGVTETAITQDNGTVGYLVEEQSTVTISASFDCLQSEEVDILHNGIDDFKSITLTLSELPCLEEESTTKYNFIRWFKSNNLSFPLSLPINKCTNCDNVDFDTPKGLQRPFQDEFCKDIYLPLLVNNEEYSIFTNFNNPVKLDNLLSPQIALVKEGDENLSQQFNAVKLSKFIAGIEYDFVYCTFTPTELEEGTYRLAIFDKNSNNIFFLSNYINLVSTDRFNYELKNRTALVKYRNSEAIDGYQYDSLSAYYNQIRINIYQDDARTFEPDFEDEDQVATAEHRYISLAHRASLPALADKFDEEACEALESMLAHDELYVNGKRYNPSPEISYEQIDLSYNRYYAKFRLFDFDYARKNKYQ